MMNPIRNILVAVKHPAAETLPAVTKAALIARACGAHVELFHAIKATAYADSPAAYEAAVSDLHATQRNQYEQRLERIAARLRLHGIQVSTAVEYDYPASDAIIRRAGAMHADLIVARRNPHRRSGTLSPRHLTDWELLRNSPIPVLLVGASRVYHHPTILAAVDPGQAHSKPAGLDEAILSTAALLSQALRGKLHVVHAYAPVVMGSAAGSVSASVGNRLEALASSEANMQFEQLLQGRNIPPARRHLVGKLPDRAISGIARRTRAGIVVLGALSRSGLKGFFIGNTAERVLEELPCDVLIVKPAQFTCRVPQRGNGLRLVSKAL